METRSKRGPATMKAMAPDRHQEDSAVGAEKLETELRRPPYDKMIRIIWKKSAASGEKGSETKSTSEGEKPAEAEDLAGKFRGQEPAALTAAMVTTSSEADIVGGDTSSDGGYTSSDEPLCPI